MLTRLISSARKLLVSRPTPVKKSASRRAWLQIESLEERTLMSATSLMTYTNVPSMTAVAVSGAQINLAWNNVAGANGYVIDEWQCGGWKSIATPGVGTTSDTIGNLNPGTTYYFWLGAYTASGTTWAATYQYATTLQNTPGAPSVTASAVSGTEIDLAWNSVTGANGYVIDQWINGAWQKIGTVDGSTTTYAVTNLNPNTTYYFWGGASNAYGTTWAATYQTATTLQNTLGVPTFTASAVSGTEIDLAWNSVTGATGYVIDQWINGSWQKIGTVDGSTTTYAVTNLNPNTTYYFWGGAVNAGGTTWAATYQTATTTSGGGNVTTIDHPTADVAYSPASGSLFGTSGPSYLDVQQGAVGDCWLLSSLAAVAAREPSIITSMFSAASTTTENGAVVSLYNVRLYDASGTAHYITVDTELPNGGSYYDQTGNGVLWVALAEKAYAEANGAGIVTSSYDGSDSYAALNGGDPSWALHAITGQSASDFAINPTNPAAAWNAGDLIVIDSSSSPASPYIVGGSDGTHAYAVVGYNPSSSQPFEVYNPWGTDANGWALGTYHNHQVYGLFPADGTFLSQNFTTQNVCTGDEADATRGLLNTTSTLAPASTRATMDAIWAEAGDPDSAGNLLAHSLLAAGIES